VTEAFQARVRHEEAFREKLDQARVRNRTPSVGNALLQIQRKLGELKTIQRSVIVDLMLSYRAVEAFEVALFEGTAKSVLFCRGR
jgi:MAP3K TRAFs-binding domain